MGNKKSKKLTKEIIIPQNNGNNKGKVFTKIENSLCIIHIKNYNKVIGFFTKILYQSQLLPVLITNSNIITKKYIEENNNIIKISLNNENENRNIKVDNSRIIFTIENLDMIIIEIKEKIDSIYNYIEIDERINEENLNDIYNNKSIYIYNLSDKKFFIKSYDGTLLNIKENILYYKSKLKEVSWSPIILKDNLKLIGIHYKNNINNNQYSQGIFIKNIISEFNRKNNNNSIINKFETKVNEITILYKINKGDKRIKIFGRKFIENNKDKCKIIINNKEQEICEYLDINKNISNKEILEIKLKETKTITNMSYIFGRYYKLEEYNLSLISIIDFSWNMENVTDISGIFAFCPSLSYISDISKWNTKNVTDMSYLFNICKSLKAIPDISQWNTKNVKNMSNMFNMCYSLSSLPDISKWDASNVECMHLMFNQCFSLISIPDISKWKIRNPYIINSAIFDECISSSILPNIYKWDKDFYVHSCINNLNILSKY